MELSELAQIVSDWYRFGRITNADRERVKAEAVRLELADPEGCKPCFWQNVKDNLIYYFRTNKIPFLTMKTGKYKLKDGVGSYMIPFTSVQLITEGEPSERLLLVADPKNIPFIEQVLEEMPELAEVIEVDPTYEAVLAEQAAKKAAETEPEDEEQEQEDEGSDEEQTAPAPKTRKPRTKPTEPVTPEA